MYSQQQIINYNIAFRNASDYYADAMKAYADNASSKEYVIYCQTNAAIWYRRARYWLDQNIED